MRPAPKTAFIPNDGCPYGLVPTNRDPSPNRPLFEATGFREVLRSMCDGMDGNPPPSDRMIESYAKQWIRDFLAVERSDRDVYDFIIEFRRKAHCGIDSFVSSLCDVETYYLRPD